MPTFAAYDDVLRDGGYRRAELSPNASAVDRETAARRRCGACDWRGLDFRPYLRRTDAGDRAYRALAVCPACGEASEV